MKSKNSIFLKILSSLDTVFVFLITTLLLVLYLTPFIEPSSFWLLSFFAITAPIVVVLTLIAFLYMLFRLKWIMFYPLAVLILGFAVIPSQFAIPILKDYHNTASARSKATTFASYNIRCFEDADYKNSVDSIASFINIYDLGIDIASFQEFAIAKKEEQFASKLKRLKYSVSHRYHTEKGSESANGLAIYSRHPIVNSGYKMFISHSGMVWADVVIGNSDTVRVFNLHLMSNGIDSSEKDLITSAVKETTMLDDDSRKDEFKGILSQFKDNLIVRAAQADTLSTIIAQSPYKVVVCGDFNDVPFSYTYSKIKGDLTDSFAQKGSGYAFSYNNLFNLLKIDYILYNDEQFEPIEYLSPHLPFSDHNPLLVTLRSL